jgi:hypothetical protein
MLSRKIDFEVVKKMALALPDVEQGTIHGAPSLKVRGKLLCCPALHSSAEPDTFAIRIGNAERVKLIETHPSVYYVTDHYLKHTTVLVRLSQIDRRSLKHLLSIGWRFMTEPKTSKTASSKGNRGEKKL